MPQHSNQVNIGRYLKGWKADWYQRELNTWELIGEILRHKKLSNFTGDDIWNLVRLTWITSNGDEVVEDGWRRLKLPALANLFRRQLGPVVDLEAAVAALGLPVVIQNVASRPTGMVNFRSVWRNSSRLWCNANRRTLIRILSDTASLSGNDRQRFHIAKIVESLNGIESPNGTSTVGPISFLSPLIACVDPYRRFPIINGRDGVRKLLHSLKLQDGGVERQVTGLVNLVGQYGIGDAFMLDVLAEHLALIGTPMTPEPAQAAVHDANPLRRFDEDEYFATTKARTKMYRTRHRRMTNGLLELFAGFQVKAGDERTCLFDALVKNYDQLQRDLLIEAKPDPDAGSVRIAIGQLLDYRRGLSNRAGTDLCLLTIGRPSQHFVDLLLDVQISLLWFTNEKCNKLRGEGKAWSALENELA